MHVYPCPTLFMTGAWTDPALYAMPPLVATPAALALFEFCERARLLV